MTSAPPTYQGYQPHPGYQPYPSATPAVPPPPPGPGVQPPFPAPPVEGKGKRIGWTLGIGAAVLLLICGGGAAAVFGLATSAQSALQEQTHKVVSAYLDALVAQRYDKAYEQLCAEAKQQESPAEYRVRVSGMEPIVGYRLEKLDLINFAVPVDATYDTGDTGQLLAYLGQNQSTGAFEVCDLGE
ncbi:hypothetical protein [Actinoplanes sp. NPDC051411]|uniref:hypothetical protein n=1 Tax=Actinoplanes sp. NPDC051411 TaxID=3155522 RepID=UPI00343315DC